MPVWTGLGSGVSPLLMHVCRQQQWWGSSNKKRTACLEKGLLRCSHVEGQWNIQRPLDTCLGDWI